MVSGPFVFCYADMPLLQKLVCLTLTLATAGPALAQPPPHETPKPANGPSFGVSSTNSALPALLDADKVFSSYRSYADQELTSWREANDEVGRIGGWQAYAREAQAPASADAASGSSGPGEGTSIGHGLHKKP